MATQFTEIIYPRTVTTRPTRRHAPLEGEGVGFTSVPDGIEELVYETRIDLDALNALARKAAGNKAQRARAGALQVRIIDRRKT